MAQTIKIKRTTGVGKPTSVAQGELFYAYDTSDAIGMSMKFKVSWQMYYRYEGAYLESSVDGGNNWDYVSQDNFISGGYYGTVFATYGNPVSTSIDTWTYYNTNNRYSYNTNTAPWQTQELVLDSYTGYSDVRFRWVVGFNQYDNTCLLYTSPSPRD